MSDASLKTNSFLLKALKAGPNTISWREFQRLYEPLIKRWIGRYAIQSSDADDLTQEVFTVIVQRLPMFEHQQRVGCFRAWLRKITIYCLRDYWRAKRRQNLRGIGNSCQDLLALLEDDNSELSREWDREHDDYLLVKLLEFVKPQFSARTYSIFEKTSLQSRPIRQVAKEYGITENAVMIAKSRVLSSLREAGDGLIELN